MLLAAIFYNHFVNSFSIIRPSIVLTDDILCSYLALVLKYLVISFNLLDLEFLWYKNLTSSSSRGLKYHIVNSDVASISLTLLLPINFSNCSCSHFVYF